MDITNFDISTWVEKEELAEYTAKLAANAEAFLATIGKEDLEVYRIEQFKPTLQPKESYGKFFQGDSYVVVKRHNDDSGNPCEYKIHYWHGQDCTSDEMGSSAAFTTQISDTMAVDSSHSLELQFHESDEFLSYFKSGIEYLPGGIESGFRPVESTEPKTRLLAVKGKRSARIFEVELTADSVNDGDVFILETPAKIIVWEGSQCNVVEKGKATYYTQSMRRYERHCKSEVVFCRDDPAIDAEFWGVLGGKPAQIKPAVPDDVPTDDEQLMHKLFEIKAEGGKVNMNEITERPLKKAMLDTTNVYILETYKQVSIWVGKDADLAEKKNALVIGKGFVEAHQKPKGTRVFRVVEGTEDQLFKSYFDGYSSGVEISPAEMDKNAEKIAALAAKKQAVVAELLTKLGKYTVKVYLCKDGNNVEIPEAEHGHFFQDEVYCIDVQGESHRYLIQWIGPRLPGDKVSANREYMAKLTDYTFSPNQITRLSVMQGHEDDTVLKFFPNGFICHDGAYKPHDQMLDTVKSGAMYRVQGPFGETPQAIQQDQLQASNLNSNEAFFVVKADGSGCFAWMGAGASDAEKAYCEKLAGVFNISDQIRVNEGSEDDEFWATLGGKAPYADTKVLNFAPGFQPRLFQINIAGGYSKFDEVCNFCQSDLEIYDVMVLDAYSTIWVWVGTRSSPVERRNATKKVDQYLAASALRDGRNKDTIQISFLEPGTEPINFTALFPEWEAEVTAKWLEVDAPKKTAPVADEKAEESKGGDYLDPTTNKFSLDVLKGSFPAGVQPDRKEQYLEPAVFQEVFGKTLEEFQAMKEWKQRDAKKAAGLF